MTDLMSLAFEPRRAKMLSGHRRKAKVLISLRAQADLGLRCPLLESFEIIIYIDGQRRHSAEIAGWSSLSDHTINYIF